MRIWVLTHYFRPEVNAPATRMYDQVTRWAEAGHDVTVVTCIPNCPDGIVYDQFRSTFRTQIEQIDGVEVVRVWTWIAANAGTIRRFANYVSYLLSTLFNRAGKKAPDIIVATTPQFFCGLAGACLSLIKHTPLVLDVRDIWPESIVQVGAMRRGFITRCLERLEKWMYACADHIVTVTDGCAVDIEKKVHDPEKVSVITNGVDPVQFSPAERNESVVREYRLRDKFVCAYVGTIGLKYDFSSLVSVAQKLRNGRHNDVTIFMVGDGSARASLEASVSQEKLSDWFRFTGRQGRKAVHGIMASTDAFLIPLPKDEFFRGTLPFKMFECMAISRPVILAGEGEAAEVVRQSHSGLVIAPEDPDEMYDAIVTLKNDEPLRKSLSRGRDLVLRRFSVDVLAHDYLQLLERVAAK